MERSGRSLVMGVFPLKYVLYAQRGLGLVAAQGEATVLQLQLQPCHLQFSHPLHNNYLLYDL